MSNLLKYDVIYILDPNSTTEEQAAVSAKVEQIVADHKGTVLKKDDWGKRRLAYLVQKHREGHYIFFHLQISTETVAEVTRNLRLMEKVIKFSVVKDTISHLKPRPRPVRTSAPRPATSSGPSAPHRSPDAVSAPSASAPVSAPAPAPAPSAPAPTNP
ncbi:MAG TPA: 30S ribosomal protein S6 [bacterium]|nr:30S ribosomal protein S6 [bacterium]